MPQVGLGFIGCESPDENLAVVLSLLSLGCQAAGMGAILGFSSIATPAGFVDATKLGLDVGPFVKRQPAS